MNGIIIIIYGHMLKWSYLLNELEFFTLIWHFANLQGTDNGYKNGAKSAFLGVKNLIFCADLRWNDHIMISKMAFLSAKAKYKIAFSSHLRTSVLKTFPGPTMVGSTIDTV